MITAAQAGPQPIHNKSLNASNLSEAIQFCLTPQALVAATEISQRMKVENGVKTAVDSFRDNLPVDELSCDLLGDEAAVWVYTRGKKVLKLSDKAAFILGKHKRIDAKQLKLWVLLLTKGLSPSKSHTRYKPRPITIENQRWDPLSAGMSVLLGTVMNFSASFGAVLSGPAKAFGGSSRSGKEAAISVGKGFGKVAEVVPKVTLVDFPLALTEGLQQMPRLYGEEVRDSGYVLDWKSGGVVAGKVSS